MWFFIIGNGRSWTVWLSSLLNQAENYTVKHEDWDHHHVHEPMYWEEFPIDRFQWNYGECSGMLLRYITPYHKWLERQVPHRYILLRKKKDLVKSRMNKGNKTMYDMWWVCYQIAYRERLLLNYHNSDEWCKKLLFHEITTDVSHIQNICDEVGIELKITEDMITNKKNQSKKEWFQWDEYTTAAYDAIMKRFAHPEGI